MIFIMLPLLVALNLWQWWPTTNSTVQQTASPVELSSLKIALPDYATPQAPDVARDIFTIKKHNSKKVTKRKSATVVKGTPAVTDIFDQVELAGVLFKNGRMNAFLLISGEAHTAVEGDVINILIVEKVSETSVTLRHRINNNKRILKMQ